MIVSLPNFQTLRSLREQARQQTLIDQISLLESNAAELRGRIGQKSLEPSGFFVLRMVIFVRYVCASPCCDAFR